MGRITTFRTKGIEKNQSHPLTKPSRGDTENVLTPVILTGVVVPWEKAMGGGRESNYKLVCASGAEYFFVTDSEWHSVLAWYCWDEVKVVGLLNLSNMTLIPQKVFPKGPTGEKENVIDLAMWKSHEIVKKVIKNVNDLVTVPAAMWSVMAL